MEYSSIFVCLMGMGTVFFGLICLIVLTYLMSAVVGRGKKAAPAPVPAVPQTAGEVTPAKSAFFLIFVKKWPGCLRQSGHFFIAGHAAGLFISERGRKRCRPQGSPLQQRTPN